MKAALHLGLVFLLGLQGALGQFNCKDGNFDAGSSGTYTGETVSSNAKLEITQDQTDKHMYKVKFAGEKFMSAYIGAYLENSIMTGMVTPGAAPATKKTCDANKEYFEIMGTAEMDSVEFTWKATGNEGKTPVFKAIYCKAKAEKTPCSSTPVIGTGPEIPKAMAAANGNAPKGAETDANKKSGAATCEWEPCTVQLGSLDGDSILDAVATFEMGAKSKNMSAKISVNV